MKTKKILFGSTLLAAAAMSFCATSANADTYTWAGKGESASWDTETANWTTDGDPTAWVNSSSSSDATFTVGEGLSKSVTIDGSITAHTVEIAGGDYTFTLGDSDSLKANAYLKVDDNASLTVDGTGSVDFVSNATIGENASLTIKGGDFTIHGTVTVNDGGSIEIDGGNVYLTYTMTINSDAKLTVSDDASFKISNATTVNGGSIEITGGDAWFQGATNISNGGSLTISGGETRFSGTGTVTVSGEGSSIEISDGSVSFGRDVTVSDGASLEISGGETTFSKAVTVSGEDSSINIEDDSSVLFNGDVTLSDGGSIDIEGGSVEFNGSIDLSDGGSLNLNGGSVAFNGKVTLAEGATFTLTGTIDLSEAISNSGEITVDTENVTLVLNDALADGTTYTFITAGSTVTDWNSLTVSNFVDSEGNELSHGHTTLNLETSGQVTITEVAADLVWNGDEGNSTWTTDTSNKNWKASDDSADYFANGDNVTFDDTATSKEVTIEGTITANSVTVSDAAYTFTIGEGYSLSATSLTIKSDASLKIMGTGSFTTGSSSSSTKIDGSLTIGSVDGTNSATTKFKGTVYLGYSADSTGTMEISGGTTTFSSSVYVGYLGTGSLTITDSETTFGTYLYIGTFGSGSLSISGGTTEFSNVTNGGSLSLSGGTITLHSAISNSGTVTVNNEVVFVLDRLSASEGTYTLISGAGTIIGWDDLTYKNFTFSSGSISARQIEFTETDGTIIYHETAVAADLVWNGTDAEGGNIWVNNDDDAKNWTNKTRADAFYNGDNVTFDNTADSKNVTISGEVIAGSVTVTGGEDAKYTFTFDTTATSSLTADTLTIDSGASLEITGAGTITLSSAISNSGTVTVSDNIVFVVNESLKVEDTYFTYTFITNDGDGTIEGWGDLTADNFVIDDALSELADDIGVVLKADGQATIVFVTESENGTATVDYDFYIKAQSETTTTGKDLTGYEGFEGIGIMVGGTVDGFVLQDATNESGEYAITGKNVYFTGTSEEGTDQLTITSINVGNEDTGAPLNTSKAFIVENCTVIIDGGDENLTANLGMNLCIGTMEDATLEITNGAKITTGAYYNFVGANLATGTITVSGEGSELSTQQISIGMSVFSLSNSLLYDGGYFAQYLESDEERIAVIQTIIDGSASGKGYEGSYGIINVEDGAKWNFAPSEATTSRSKLQLANGEINVKGGELVLGEGSGFIMMGESSIVGATWNESEQKYVYDTKVAEGVMLSQTINVTDGGKIYSTGEKGVFEVGFGDNWFGAKETTTVTVDGAGSSFDVYVGTKYNSGYIGAYFGSYRGYWSAGTGFEEQYTDGGTEDTTISATNGGEFKVKTEGNIYAAVDNYLNYVDDPQYTNITADSEIGHSYGLNVDFTAETGGSIELEAAGDVLLAAGSPKTEVGADGNNAYTNNVTVKADGTSEDGDTASSVTISGANIYTNYGTDGTNDTASENVYVTITAKNGGTISLTATGTNEGDDGIVFNKNTSVIIEEGSSLTLSGSVTVAEGASMDLNGTIDLSNQIQNSGEITVGEDVVFVLREDDENFKDEDTHFNFTYDFIINTEAGETTQTTGGSIEGWDSLTIDNFSIVASDDDNEVPENLGIVTKADGQATVVFVTEDESGGTATVDYDYYIEYKRGNGFEGNFFYCIGITVDGTVDSFVLQDRTSITGDLDDITKAITDKDVLFIGSGETDGEGNLVDSVTITSMNIDNGETSSSGRYSTTKAFAVEGTKVIIDNVTIDELGMNIVVGTMYDVGDAELQITNGAQVTTSACYSTVGANLATGTITITGEGSMLANQQITLGSGVNSLFPSSIAAVGQYQTKYFVDTDTYNNDIRDVLVSSNFDPTSGSYGIVNVTDGGTWKVGVGNADSTNSRLQLSNGEVNIDGEGSQLIFGTSSTLMMCNENLFTDSRVGSTYTIYTEMNISEKVTVTNGGTVSVETDASGNAQTMTQLVVGETYVGENVVAEISVDGEGSSFVISAQQVYIGSDSGYYTSNYAGIYNVEGGSSTTKILATDGGVIDIFAAVDPLIICADNYASYIGSMSENVKMDDALSSHGLDVEIKASHGEGENGSTISLGSIGWVLLGGGSPTTADENGDNVNDYTNNLAITADGEGCSVSIAGTNIITNYGTDGTDASDNVYVTITATNGGEITITAGDNSGVEPDSVKPYDDPDPTGYIIFNKNTSVIVDKDSSLTLSGAVTLAAGASMDFAGTETISDTLDSQGAITVSDGTLDVASISVTKADGSESTTDGVLTIEGGTVSVETLTIGDESLGGSFSMSDGTLNVSETGGFSIASAASASFSGGTVNVSTAIANDGSVTVSDSIVFVLNDSLKVEGTSATYAIIINGEGGEIKGWGDLGTSNFVYSDLSALATNVVLDLTTDGYVTLLYKEGGVTINYDYEVPWQRGTHGLSGYDPTGADPDKALYYFRAMHIEIDDPSVGGFTLQDLTNEEGDYAISSKNVYITGSGKDESKLTITDIKVSNESAGYYAFVVENATVDIDGKDVNVSELGMSLCIGTMESAELKITGGAQVSTGGVWSTIGSNMATGTLTISGKGSSLTNAQINIGMATTSLSGMSDTTAAAGVDGYYYANYIETDDAYNAVIAKLTSTEYKPTDGSYGIVNVLEGGTWTVCSNDTSTGRIQLSNGEINIDGEGSSLIFGTNSSLVMGNMTSSLTDANKNSVTLTVSETINVKNGGTVKAADGVTLYQFYIGQIRGASKGEATISVDGEDSSFNVSAEWVYFGMKNETTAGGTEDVKVSASNGGTIKISGSSNASAFSVGYTSSSSRQADQMTTSFTAESGGKITLENNASSYALFFGRNTATTTEASGIDVLATGEGSEVNIISTNKSIYTNYDTSNFNTSFTAEDGGKLTMTSGSNVVFGYNSGDYSDTSNTGTVRVTASGTGSMVMISSDSDLEVNRRMNRQSETYFTAEDGGYLSIDVTVAYFGDSATSAGTINVTADGDGSLVNISASSCIYFNGYESSNLAVNISASDGGALIFSGTQVQFCANTKVEISSGGTLSTTATLFENTSSFSLDATSYWLSTGVATVEEGAELALNGRVEVTTAISNSGTITVSDSSLFVLSKALQDETDESGNTYIVIDTAQDSVETWHGLKAHNFIFDNGTNLGRSVVNVSIDGVVTITDQEESATLIWNGKNSLHEWDNQEEDKDWKNGSQDDSFWTGDNVIFNEVAENKDVLIHEESITAGTITVEVSEEADPDTEIEYIFDFDNNASLIGESLSVGEGTSLTVTGDGSLEISSELTGGTGETDIAGDMTVTGGAKANFDDGVTVEEGGSLTVTSDEETGASGSVNVSGDLDVNGSLDVSGGSLTADNLTLSKDEKSETGASAEFSGGETTIDGKVTVDENSTLTVDGGTLNASDLTIASDDNADFSSGNLNIGSLTVTDNGGVTFGDGLTVGAYDEDGLDLDLDITLDGSVGFDTSNGDIDIKGTLSDGTDDENPGSLTKTGSGTLTLEGENDYSGGTTIDEGTIEADNTDALGTGEVDIHKGATLKIHSSDSSSDTPDEFENSTTGEGTLEITDGSDIHFTEDVGVQNVIVDSGATLNGDTTLTHSDASLDLKGTLEISVDNEEHITISASGKVVIEYDATLDLESPTLRAGDSFVIVDGGTVTGDIDHFLGTDETLSSMQSDYAIIYDTSNGLSVSIENTGTRSIPNMRLHDGLYSDFIAAVITEEDMTIVAGIQGTGDVSSNPIARELLNGNVSRAVEMLNTLAPNDYAAMIAMPTTAYHNDISSLDKRLAAVRAMPFSEDENARWGYFAQADGTFAENDNANDTPTFDFQLYGVLAGADYRMSNTLTVGVALGYDHEHAKLHNSGGRIDGDDVRLTIYAGTQITDLVYANVGAQIGYGHYEARRHTVMGRASGETDGYNAGVFADVGMDLPLSEKHGISARPYVGLAYLRSFVSGFDDSLFDIGSFNNDSLMARVGLGVFWDLGGVSLGLDTSFTHDFCGEEIDDMSATYRATGSKFSMMAECVPEDVFSVGPVVSVGISEGISAFAGYSFQAGSNEYIGHNVYIGVRANF